MAGYRNFAGGLATKAVLWANRRKIVKGYNKFAKPFTRRLPYAKKVSRFVKRGMRSYRKYTPKTVRRGMAW